MRFEELMKELMPKLKGIVYRLKARPAYFSSDDLLQECLLILWVKFKRGELADKTPSYILQGCYFHLKNHLRKEKLKYKLMSLDEAIGDEEARLEDFLEDKKAAGFFEDLNAKLIAQTIRNNGLSGKEKDILFLYAEGLATREIGTRFGVSHVSIVKAMKLIREKCRKHIDYI